MTTDRPTQMTFTKLVVDDLEAISNYYCSVFDLHRGFHEKFESGIGGEPIEEIALAATPGDRWGALTLLKFLNRPAAQGDGAIIGFTTSDLEALLERVRLSGGDLVGEIKEMPRLGIRVAFARDPEGHLNELVELRT